MRELVLITVLISAVSAYYDEQLDYWYSNDDGVFVDNLLSINSERSDSNSNNTSFPPDVLRSIEEVHHELFSQRHQDLPKLSDLRSKGTKLSSSILSTVAKLKKGVGNNKECKYGQTTMIDCNECVCMAPLLYVCTSNICGKAAKEAECVEGTTVLKKGCKECYCYDGKPVCYLMNCPTEKYSKGLTALKNTVQAKNGVQCTIGESIKVDDCNTCFCAASSIFCTMVLCDAEPEVPAKSKKTSKYSKCQKGTWYSPSGSLECRNCYCLDEKVSFCFSGICDTKKESVKGTGKNVLKKSKYYKVDAVSEEEDTDLFECKPGQKKLRGKCTSCVCSRKGYWQCTKLKSCQSKTSKVDDSFLIGTINNCHGCIYSMGVWDCFSADSKCSDFDSTKKKISSIFSNSQGPCSACYTTGFIGNVCATDVSCSVNYFISSKPIGQCKSDSACRTACTDMNKWSGKCVLDSCICF